MSKRFVWIFGTLVSVAVIVAAIFTFIVINDLTEQQRSAGSSTAVASTSDNQSDQTKMAAFIAETHTYYQKAAKDQGGNSIDQQAKAEQIVDFIKNYQGKTKVKENDLKAILKIANRFNSNEGLHTTSDLRRYFHDLDIAINDFTGYETTWGVTETLGSPEEE